jgi:hypothetical protein
MLREINETYGWRKGKRNESFVKGGGGTAEWNTMRIDHPIGRGYQDSCSWG